MPHDLETAQELLDRGIQEGVTEYFEFVRHRLEDALVRVNTTEELYAKTGDHRAILQLVKTLSELDFGYSRAVQLVYKVTKRAEEVALLEDQRDEQSNIEDNFPGKIEPKGGYE